MPHFTHHSEENYLKALYKLSSKDVRKVNNIALAKLMSLNPATVLEMVRKLSDKKLVQLLPDKSIQLTDKGKKEALLIIRKHRLWEVFLVEKLNYDWNEVHALAEQLEHVDSEDLINRLEEFLNYPAFDPHGDPLPDRQGRMQHNVTVPLFNCSKGKTYVVQNFAETDDHFLDYLSKLSIKPGVKLKIIDVNEFDLSHTVSIAKQMTYLSEKAARNIMVLPAS
ncbi:MAG: metal-dependent transcriptional regulator [Chitinophagaceae bacterium]